jgi:hypothetical protein
MAGRHPSRGRDYRLFGKTFFRFSTTLAAVVIASTSSGQMIALPDLPPVLESTGSIQTHSPSDVKPSADLLPIHVEGLISDRDNCDQGSCDQNSCDQMICHPSQSECDDQVAYLIRSGRQPLWGCLPCPQDPGTLMDWPCQSRTAGVPRLWEPIVSDRSTFTESSSVVGLGVAQLEFGGTFNHEDEPGVEVRQYSIGEPLLRYGIYRDWLELRLGTGYQKIDVNGQDFSGVDNMLVGFKIGLLPQDGLRPEMALIAQTFAPTGSDEVTQDEWLPELKLIYGWEANERFATRGSTQVARAVTGNSNDDDVEWSQSWMASYRLHPRLRVLGEWFAVIPPTDEVTDHYVSAGFTYLLTNDIQWDLRGGQGINDEALDSFVTTGLSWRFR